MPNTRALAHLLPLLLPACVADPVTDFQVSHAAECAGTLRRPCDCPDAGVGTMACEDERWGACQCDVPGFGLGDPTAAPPTPPPPPPNGCACPATPVGEGCCGPDGACGGLIGGFCLTPSVFNPQPDAASASDAGGGDAGDADAPRDGSTAPDATSDDAQADAPTTDSGLRVDAGGDATAADSGRDATAADSGRDATSTDSGRDATAADALVADATPVREASVDASVPDASADVPAVPDATPAADATSDVTLPDAGNDSTPADATADGPGDAASSG